MLRSNLKKMVVAGIATGALMLGTFGAQALVSVEGVSLPVNGGNSGNSTQNMTRPEGGAGGGLLTLVTVGLIDAPLNVINTGNSCQSSNATAECSQPEAAPAP